jgi:hypothetical protein
MYSTNEEFHDMCCSINKQLEVMKSRKVIWEECIAHIRGQLHNFNWKI